MIFITGLDFTLDPPLFSHLQNRGRELLSSAASKLMKMYRFPFVLAVTCDRAEVIGLSRAGSESLERVLSLNPAAATRCRYSLEGDEAVRHVFLLASGTLSPLFGEDTIQGQLAMAGDEARLAGSSSPELNKLVNMAVAFSKDLHSRLKVRVFDSSIAEAAALRLEGMKRILIAGSGESARLVAVRLLQSGHDVRMALRDETKTFLVPAGAEAVPFADKMKEAFWADAVVSASSGLYHTFSAEECARIAPRIMLDLARPRDLPDCPNVITASDLNAEEPEKERVIKTVECEAGKAVSEYMQWLERSRTRCAVESRAEELAFEVMRRLSGPVASLSLDAERERQLREAIIDSAKKAYITKSYSRSHGDDIT